MKIHTLLAASVAVAAVLVTSTANAALFELTFTNNAPSGGGYLTPLWAGFHDGNFDTFSAGGTASAGLESIAEDGNPTTLSMEFNAGSTGVDGVAGAAPIAPGASVSLLIDLANDGSNDFLSYASMVLASSDFFVGNDDPMALSLVNLLNGSVNSLVFDVGQVFDAGTEINDFATSAGNGLLGISGGQSGPNQGADQNGVVALASSADYGSYLNLSNVPGSNFGPFSFDNYQPLASISLTRVPQNVPLPGTVPLLAVALAGFGFVRRRRSQVSAG